MMGKPICWVQVSIVAATSTLPLPLTALLREFQRSLSSTIVFYQMLATSQSNLVTVLPYLCLFM